MAAALPVLVNEDLNRAKNKKACDEVIPFVYKTVIAWGCSKDKDELFLTYYNRRPEKLWDDNKGEWEKEVEEKLKTRDMRKWPKANKEKEKDRITKELKKEKAKEILIMETWTQEDEEHLAQETCDGLDATFLHKLVPTICDGIGRYDRNAPSSTYIEQFLREVKNIRNDICHDPKGASISGTILDKLDESAVNVFKAAGVLYATIIDKQKVQDKIDELKEMLKKIKTEVMTEEQEIILQTAKKLSEDGMAEMHAAVKKQDTDFLPLSDDKVMRMDVFYSVDLLIKNHYEEDNKDASTENNKNKKTIREILSHELLQHFDGSNVLCEGQPGTGKTTLLKALCEDFGENHKERFRGVRKFDLLMYMECRNNSIMTVEQLLEHQLPKTFQQLDKKKAVEALYWLKLLICVDGLDELMSHTKKLLKELISKFGHSGMATFIFTSRPGQARSVSLRHETVTLQSIKGEDQQVVFLRRYQAGIKGFEGPDFINAFESLNETCKAVLRQPVYLALFCALFRKSPEAVQKWKNEITLLNDFLSLSKQTMIDRMDTMDLKNPVCCADHVMTAIFELSLCLLQQEKMIFTATTYTHICGDIFRDATVEYYPIMSTFFTMHPDQQTFEFYHISHAEFFAAKAIAPRFVSNPAVGVVSTIQAICSKRSRYFQFQNTFRFVCMLIHEWGPPMEGALKSFLADVCPALAKAGVGLDYWTDLVLSCPDSDQVARAAAEAVHSVSKGKWTVRSSRAMTATSKMLPYRQPSRLIIKPLRGEENHAALTMLLEAVKHWHTGVLNLKLHESQNNYSACDASPARCELNHFKGCLKGGSSAACCALGAERGRPSPLHISLLDPKSQEPGQLDGTDHYRWRIIIVGGVREPVTQLPSFPNSIALFGTELPLFPGIIHGNTLSMVEDTVYSCGGYGGSSNSNKQCWAITTSMKGIAWCSFDIPWELGYHSAVVVQNEIWFFLDSTLRIFHTRNPALKFREFKLNFSFGLVTCAAAHGAQTFVIGVGEEKREVYVNSDSSKPDQWKKFSTLLQGRGSSGCHVFRGEIFVTGGYVQATNTFLSSVEAISVEDGTVRSISPLIGVRADHKMAIIEGRLVVLGGFNGAAGILTIESYDGLNDSWETLNNSLNVPRCHFGLTQYLS